MFSKPKGNHQALIQMLGDKTPTGFKQVFNQLQPDLAAAWPHSPRIDWPEKTCKKEQVCINGPRLAGVIWDLNVMMLCGWMGIAIFQTNASKKPDMVIWISGLSGKVEGCFPAMTCTKAPHH